MKNSRVKLGSFKKLITNREEMKENGKNIKKKILELLEEELYLEELTEIT